MSDFDPAWPHGHVTRDGRKARIICTDAYGARPIVALLRYAEGEETAWTYIQCGQYYSTCTNGLDLINAPPPAPPKIERWGVVLADSNGVDCVSTFPSREGAEGFSRACCGGAPTRIVHLVESET